MQARDVNPREKVLCPAACRTKSCFPADAAEFRSGFSCPVICDSDRFSGFARLAGFPGVLTGRWLIPVALSSFFFPPNSRYSSLAQAFQLQASWRSCRGSKICETSSATDCGRSCPPPLGQKRSLASRHVLRPVEQAFQRDAGLVTPDAGISRSTPCLGRFLHLRNQAEVLKTRERSGAEGVLAGPETLVGSP